MSEHHDEHGGTNPLTIVLAWALVGIPLLYGLWQTLLKAFQLLGG